MAFQAMAPRQYPQGCPRVGALARGSPLIWGKYSHESEFYSKFTNITNILVSFTSTFTDILEFISKFTNILVNSLVIDLFICNIVPCNNLTRLPIFFRDPFFRGITRFK